MSNESMSLNTEELEEISNLMPEERKKNAKKPMSKTKDEKLLEETKSYAKVMPIIATVGKSSPEKKQLTKNPIPTSMYDFTFAHWEPKPIE